jgi:recombination protein RecR
MNSLPKSLISLIDSLQALPGVGPKSAERFAYHLLKSSKNNSLKIADALNNLHDNIIFCPITFALIDKGQQYSKLYTDPGRDKTTIAVVAETFDIIAIEKTGAYKGTYHVLGGLISPIDGIDPDQLSISQLIKRIKKDGVKEIILATNASVEGESTALFLQKKLENGKIKITRLARGLPIGVDLEYADQITLTRALEGRQKL